MEGNINMKTLNLTDLQKSDIKYKISNFPDGQQNITIESYIFVDDISNTKIQIKSRLNNFKDLELVVCATKSLRGLGVREIHLYTPYFLGSRSDRKFEEGGNNYLKDVICPIINSLNFKTVTCIDPHSDVLEACIKGFRKESNISLFSWVTHELGYHEKGYYKGLEKCILISPDAGASKKIYKLAEQIGYKGDIITCSKDRDKDGKLTKFKIDLSSVQEDNKDYIIIDDICDGGATFINIAKSLKEQEIRGKIYLIVTHGIFSKKYAELDKYFDGIYCTNSYQDLYINDFPELKKFKQLNVY